MVENQILFPINYTYYFLILLILHFLTDKFIEPTPSHT